MDTMQSSPSPSWRRDDAPPPISGLALDTDVALPRRGPRQIAPTGEEMARDRIASAERYSRTRSTIRPIPVKDPSALPGWFPKVLGATIVVIALMALASRFL